MKNYDDIIHLPHHESPTRPRMPRENRAAQFSPFAALTGNDAAIAETGRLTDARIELGDGAIAELDRKLRFLGELAPEHPEIMVTFFQPDEKKDGGAYVTATGAVKKIDDVQCSIVLMDGKHIAIGDVLELECERFGDLA